MQPLRRRSSLDPTSQRQDLRRACHVPPRLSPLLLMRSISQSMSCPTLCPRTSARAAVHRCRGVTYPTPCQTLQSLQSTGATAVQRRVHRHDGRVPGVPAVPAGHRRVARPPGPPVHPVGAARRRRAEQGRHEGAPFCCTVRCCSAQPESPSSCPAFVEPHQSAIVCWIRHSMPSSCLDVLTSVLEQHSTTTADQHNQLSK